MRADAHIFEFDIPDSPKGKNFIAPCGVAIENAQIAFSWDTQVMRGRLNLRDRGICQHCAEIVDAKWAEEGVRYVWGIVSEKYFKQQESDL